MQHGHMAQAVGLARRVAEALCRRQCLLLGEQGLADFLEVLVQVGAQPPHLVAEPFVAGPPLGTARMHAQRALQQLNGHRLATGAARQQRAQVEAGRLVGLAQRALGVLHTAGLDQQPGAHPVAQRALVARQLAQCIDCGGRALLGQAAQAIHVGALVGPRRRQAGDQQPCGAAAQPAAQQAHRAHRAHREPPGPLICASCSSPRSWAALKSISAALSAAKSPTRASSRHQA